MYILYKNGAEETLFLLFFLFVRCTNSIYKKSNRLALREIDAHSCASSIWFNICFSVCYYRVNVYFPKQNCVLHFYLHLWVIIVFTYFHYILWRMDKWNNFYYFWVFQWTFLFITRKKKHTKIISLFHVFGTPFCSKSKCY